MFFQKQANWDNFGNQSVGMWLGIWAGSGKNRNIEELNFANNQLSGQAVVELAPVTKELNGLRSVNLCNNRLSGDSAAKALGQIIEASRHLEDLDISQNEFDAGCVGQILSSCKKGRANQHILTLVKLAGMACANGDVSREAIMKEADSRGVKWMEHEEWKLAQHERERHIDVLLSFRGKNGAEVMPMLPAHNTSPVDGGTNADGVGVITNNVVLTPSAEGTRKNNLVLTPKSGMQRDREEGRGEREREKVVLLPRVDSDRNYDRDRNDRRDSRDYDRDRNYDRRDSRDDRDYDARERDRRDDRDNRVRDSRRNSRDYEDKRSGDRRDDRDRRRSQDDRDGRCDDRRDDRRDEAPRRKKRKWDSSEEPPLNKDFQYNCPP